MSKTPVLNSNESGKQFSFPNSNPSNSKLKTFTPTTIDELRSIIHETGLKTSTNDPLPKSMIGDDIEFWLPYLCDLVNCSLNSGSIEGAKLAHLTPLIKSNSLDPTDLKNYRPISNLSFIGKLIERVVLKRLNDHMAQNNLQIPFQSAYKKHHSTETLLIRIVNDLLITIDENKATVVMLLDLSAAFDTVDHNKLLNILKYKMGLEGEALNWFRSFLCGGCQKVRVEGYESVEILIKFGVPQGSVWGQSCSTFILDLFIIQSIVLISIFMALLTTIRYSNLSIWDSNSMCWLANFPNCSTRLQIG